MLDYATRPRDEGGRKGNATMSEWMHQRARRLEDMFFLEQDRKLIEKKKELRRMEHTRSALTAVSGIVNPSVLDKLIELEITPELLATLAVVPLVEVAWADGHVHEDEKAAILSGARASGLAAGSMDYVLLEQWLSHRPEPKLLEAWTHYIRGLCEKLSVDEADAMRDDVMARARKVAEAAGGFLGITSKVSPAELAVMEQMGRAFSS